MYGVPPAFVTASVLVRLPYALSAETSEIAKFLAVVSTIGANIRVSFVYISPIATAVTMFVLTPHIRWHFTQSCLTRSFPYFTSNQRVKREVVKPEESTAKLVSTLRSGKL